jgi:hypothetical protein
LRTAGYGGGCFRLSGFDSSVRWGAKGVAKYYQESGPLEYLATAHIRNLSCGVLQQTLMYLHVLRKIGPSEWGRRTSLENMASLSLLHMCSPFYPDLYTNTARKSQVLRPKELGTYRARCRPREVADSRRIRILPKCVKWPQKRTRKNKGTID